MGAFLPQNMNVLVTVGCLIDEIFIVTSQMHNLLLHSYVFIIVLSFGNMIVFLCGFPPHVILTLNWFKMYVGNRMVI